MSCLDGSTVEALVYTATPDNPHFLGDAPLSDIAKQVSEVAVPCCRSSTLLTRGARMSGCVGPAVQTELRGARP